MYIVELFSSFKMIHPFTDHIRHVTYPQKSLELQTRPKIAEVIAPFRLDQQFD